MALQGRVDPGLQGQVIVDMYGRHGGLDHDVDGGHGGLDHLTLHGWDG